MNICVREYKEQQRKAKHQREGRQHGMDVYDLQQFAIQTWWHPSYRAVESLCFDAFLF